MALADWLWLEAVKEQIVLVRGEDHNKSLLLYFILPPNVPHPTIELNVLNGFWYSCSGAKGRLIEVTLKLAK